MERPRSVLEIYNREREKSGKKRQDSPPGSWSKKPELYKWEERSSKWDMKEAERLANESAKDMAKARAAWVADEIEIAKKLLAKGKAGVDIPLIRGKVTSPDGKVTELKGDPVAVKTAVYMLVEGIRIGRTALGIPDAARLWPLLNKYRIPLDALTTEQMDRIARGDDPLEVVIEALSLLAQQRPAE